MPVTLQSISKEADKYFKKFNSFKSKYKLSKHKPATIGWKVKDIDEYTETISSFLKKDLIDQFHIGFVDRRYIASIVFKKPIYKEIYILKLMQRRPNSKDPVGLDHVDFSVNSLSETAKELDTKDIENWGYEANESHKWISVRFSDTEAKFVDHIVLDVCIKELKTVMSKLGFKSKNVK